MSELFASGRIVDFILALMVLEGAGLALLYRKTGRGVPVSAIAANLVAGAALLLAVRAALTGAPWGHIAACLVAGLIAHVIELAQRWK